METLEDYGGYAVGNISLDTKQNLYICVGGVGQNYSGINGGLGRL